MLELLHDPAFQQSVITLFTVVVTFITAWLGRAGVGVVNTIKADKKNALFLAIVDTAVQAVEQGKIAGLVDDKKQAAIDAVNIALTNFGIRNITGQQISAAIEASVWKQFKDIEAAIETPAEETK